MKIRTRLIVVLSVLGGMIAVVSLTAVTAFARLGGAVAQAVNENLRSIDAGHEMMVAIDLQDRGFLLLLAGESVAGREAILRGTQRFAESLESARRNITVEGEQQVIDAIAQSYAQFFAAAQRFRSPASGTTTSPPAVAAPAAEPGASPDAAAPAEPGGRPAGWSARAAVGASPAAVSIGDYMVLAEPHLLELRDAIRDLSGLNRANIESQAKAGTRSGWRRSAWVVSVGVLGLAIAVLLGRRLYRSLTVPIEAISRGISAIGQGDLARRVPHEGRDELGQIAAALNATADRLAATEASREGKLRMHERLAAAVLDAFDPSSFVVDREGGIVLIGRRIKERLGADPLKVLRAGADGLLPPGEIDRRLDEMFSSRPSQLPMSMAPPPPSERVVLRPVIGRGGSLLGALIRVELPAVR
jgi:HAMP domain-containing protein